ncbi:MAG: hypothetical protein ACXVCF_21865, partial [Isosphaeraceae bacterium]
LRKTARLVQEHTETGKIQAPDKIHKLDANTLEKIAEADTPDTVKVFNLLNALHAMVQEKGREQPYLISIGDKAGRSPKPSRIASRPPRTPSASWRGWSRS